MGEEHLNHIRSGVAATLWLVLRSLRIRDTNGYSLLLTLEEGDVQKCEMTKVFVSFEFLYLLAAGGEMLLISRVFCLCVEFVCEVQLRWLCLDVIHATVEAM